MSERAGKDNRFETWKSTDSHYAHKHNKKVAARASDQVNKWKCMAGTAEGFADAQTCCFEGVNKFLLRSMSYDPQNMNHITKTFLYGTKLETIHKIVV